MIEYVIKRNGSKEAFDAKKLNDMATWSVSGLDVAWSDIAMKAVKSLSGYTEIKTSDIQKALIKTAIDSEDPIHNKVAARLFAGDLVKSTKVEPSFYLHYKKMVEEGFYREMKISDENLMALSEVVAQNVDKDLYYSYPTLRQFVDKYAVKDANGEIKELPQYAFAAIALSMLEGSELKDITDYYLEISDQKVNLPSPVLSQQRTKNNTGVSCVITTAGDTLQGIEATKHIVFMATASSAGLGVEYDVRSVKDTVRNGYAEAGGKLPHYRVLDKIVKEVKQSSRGGSATVSFKAIDPEIETLLGLKLKRAPENKKIDQLDYSLLMNDTFLQRAAKKLPWALVSKVDCPELHERFSFSDFGEIMERVLSTDSIKKTVVNAFDILSQFVDNRLETGRIYRTNLTEVNRHTPFKEEVRLSNLCQEVLLPTKPYNHITELYKTQYSEGDGVTAQCFLSALDLARLETDEDYERAAYLTLKGLDNLIENMNYPFPQFKVTAQAYRSVGVGATNLAYHLAKVGKSYADVEHIHWLAERHYYFLLKASIRLARERGAFQWGYKTKWVDGWLPIDTYNKNVDNIYSGGLKYDWETLRHEIRKVGVRFSTLTAFMPCESSSVFGNSTNGLYPIRETLVYKVSKKGNVQFFAPDVEKYKYENAYDLNPYVVLNMYALFQKFNDQTISADTYVKKTEGTQVSKAELIKQQLYSNKIGLKCLYYNNTYTDRGNEANVDDPTGCESCSL